MERMEQANTLSKQEEIGEEYHEHPFFNGSYHKAVWVQIWSGGGTNEIEAPEGVPVTCAICGRARGELNAKRIS